MGWWGLAMKSSAPWARPRMASGDPACTMAEASWSCMHSLQCLVSGLENARAWPTFSGMLAEDDMVAMAPLAHMRLSDSPNLWQGGPL